MTAPKLPRLADGGGKAIADTRTVLGGEGFAVSAVSTAVVHDDNTITLAYSLLGLLTVTP